MMILVGKSFMSRNAQEELNNYSDLKLLLIFVLVENVIIFAISYI